MLERYADKLAIYVPQISLLCHYLMFVHFVNINTVEDVAS